MWTLRLFLIEKPPRHILGAPAHHAVVGVRRRVAAIPSPRDYRDKNDRNREQAE